MALTTEQKAQILKDFAQKEGDTGSPEVQVALLSENINPVSYTHLTLPTILLV